jgi:hypothetical protein
MLILKFVYFLGISALSANLESKHSANGSKIVKRPVGVLEFYFSSISGSRFFISKQNGLDRCILLNTIYPVKQGQMLILRHSRAH